MAKTRGLIAVALFGGTLWVAQPAAGQDPLDRACDESVRSGCAAGTFNDSTFLASPPLLFTPASDVAQVTLIEPPDTPSPPGPQSQVQIDFAQLNETHEALVNGRSAALTVNLPDLPLPVVFDHHE